MDAIEGFHGLEDTGAFSEDTTEQNMDNFQ